MSNLKLTFILNPYGLFDLKPIYYKFTKLKCHHFEYIRYKFKYV